MLIQYIIDSPPKNTSNGRGNWILHNEEKQALRKGGAIKDAFEWDKRSQLRMHFHRFAAKNQPMDDDGLCIAFKPVRDGLIESLSQCFDAKFDDGNQDLFHFVYSQCKAWEPVFADTIVITMVLMDEQSCYSSVVMRWGYFSCGFVDKQSLITDLAQIRAAKIDSIKAEIKRSRTGTKKVAALEKELAKTCKAYALCYS